MQMLFSIISATISATIFLIHIQMSLWFIVFNALLLLLLLLVSI